MFAKVLSSAKRILSRSPSAQDLQEQFREDTPRSYDADTGMVISTRRGPVTPSSSVQKPKAKRSLEVQETPTVSKRRRRLGKSEVDDLIQADQSSEGSGESQTRSSSDPSQALDSHSTKGPQQQGEGSNAGSAPFLSDASRTQPAQAIQQITEIIDQSPDDSSNAIEVRSTRKQQIGTEQGFEAEEKLPLRRHGSPKVVIANVSSRTPVREEKRNISQDSAFHTPGTHRASSVFETPMTSCPEEVSLQTARLGRESVGHKSEPRETRSSKKVSAKDNDELERLLRKKADGSMTIAEVAPKLDLPEEIPSSTWERDDSGVSTQESHQLPSTIPVPKVHKAHFRFGSEEPAGSVDHDARATSGVVVGQLSHDDGSDSDEAPEEIAAANAKSKAQTFEVEAAKAFKAQQERERILRIERKDRMTQEQERKRKKLEKKASEFAKVEAKKQARRREGGVDLDMNDLPALLPASILETAGDMRPPTPPLSMSGKIPEEKREELLKRHIQFLELGQNPVKDVRKGSVNLRILEKQINSLAPKVSRDTKHVREKWLKGRQVEKKDRSGSRKVEFRKIQRKAYRGGFVKEEN